MSEGNPTGQMPQSGESSKQEKSSEEVYLDAMKQVEHLYEVLSRDKFRADVARELKEGDTGEINWIRVIVEDIKEKAGKIRELQNDGK